MVERASLSDEEARMRRLADSTHKELFTISALLLGVVLLALWLPHIEWNSGCQITPFTGDLRITVPVWASRFERPREASPIVYATVTTFKGGTRARFSISPAPYGSVLARAFYTVSVTIRIDEQTLIFTVIDNNRWWGNGDIQELLVLPNPVTRAPLEISVAAYPALHGAVSGILEIIVSLVEPS